MSKINIYDAFFRRFFSDKKFAIDIFRKALPPAQFNLFAWESLKSEETSYFDHEGNEKKADLVFTVKLKKNRKAANLVMLLEHNGGTRMVPTPSPQWGVPSQEATARIRAIHE